MLNRPKTWNTQDYSTDFLFVNRPFHLVFVYDLIKRWNISLKDMFRIQWIFLTVQLLFLQEGWHKIDSFACLDNIENMIDNMDNMMSKKVQN